MSDDIAVQFGGDVAPLTSALASLSGTMQRVTDQMSSALSRLGTQSVSTSSQMRNSFEQVSVASEGMGRRFEHVGISVAFAANSLADGAEGGLTRALHGVAALGFAFGATGGVIVTGLAIAAERMIEFFRKTSEEAAKTKEKIDQMYRSIGESGSLEQASKRAQQLFSGDQFIAKDDPLSGLIQQGGLDAAQRRLHALQAARGALVKPDPTSASFDVKDQEKFNQAITDFDTRIAKATADVATLRDAWKPVNDLVQQFSAQTGELAKNKLGTEQADAAKKIASDAANGAILLTKAINDGYAQTLAFENHAREEINRSSAEIVAKIYDIQKKITAAYTKAWDDFVAKAQASIGQLVDQQAADYERAQADMLAKTTQGWQTTFFAIESAWTNTVRKIQSGTDSIRNFWRDLWHDLVGFSVQAELRMLEAHAAAWLAKRHLSVLGFAEEVALAAASALKIIATYAAQAAAAAWSSLAAIPIVGPVLAPAAAIATLAGVLALASQVRSAAGGFDVPAGLNPMTQLHAQEMVLPADLANKVRSMTDGGGDHYHVHIHAVDAKDVKRLFTDHSDALGDGVVAAIKSGRIKAKLGP